MVLIENRRAARLMHVSTESAEQHYLQAAMGQISIRPKVRSEYSRHRRQ
jgi:hypothetical protein